MTLNFLDWTIVVAVLGFVFIMAFYTRRYNRSVADFLSASRCAGRYMLSVSEGMAVLGAISIAAQFEMYYNAGFTAVWWGLLITATFLILNLSGFVTYRYRQTRAMTMAQFIEIRYSRKLRLFAGGLAFLAGIMTYSITPAVTARFLMSFCNLPDVFHVAGMQISTYPVIMFIELGLALFFVFSGGQIAIMVTDFLQGLAANIALIIILCALICTFNIGDIVTGLQAATAGASKLNPFDAGKVQGFDVWFFLIWVFSAIYTRRVWQGTQGFQTSAKTPHEAKMAGVLGSWRATAQALTILMIPIFAYAVLHNPKFTNTAQTINYEIAKISAEPQVHEQMTVPIALRYMLPAGYGLLGLFTVVLITAAISTDDSQLHSWGSIFIQDIILPLRKKPLAPKKHILFLRIACSCVAIFAFIFSLFFCQVDFILMFYASCTAIYLGGGGAVIIGGLYWKRGTTLAAWCSLICGMIVAFSGLLLSQPVIWKHLGSVFVLLGGSLAVWPEKFPINGQYVFLISMISSASFYIIISLCSNKKYNMEHLLHGEDSFATKDHPSFPMLGKLWRRLGFSTEFSRSDSIIFTVSILWTFVSTLVFAIGTIYVLFWNISDKVWIRFWLVYVGIVFVIAIIITIWFLIGGIIDMRNLFRDLSVVTRDEKDSGRVDNQ